MAEKALLTGLIVVGLFVALDFVGEEAQQLRCEIQQVEICIIHVDEPENF